MHSDHQRYACHSVTSVNMAFIRVVVRSTRNSKSIAETAKQNNRLGLMSTWPSLLGSEVIWPIYLVCQLSVTAHGLAESDWWCFRDCAISRGSHGRPQDFFQGGGELFSRHPQNTGFHCNYKNTKYLTTFPGASALKTFQFFEGGACAMAQWPVQVWWAFLFFCSPFFLFIRSLVFSSAGWAYGVPAIADHNLSICLPVCLCVCVCLCPCVIQGGANHNHRILSRSHTITQFSVTWFAVFIDHVLPAGRHCSWAVCYFDVLLQAGYIPVSFWSQVKPLDVISFRTIVRGRRTFRLQCFRHFGVPYPVVVTAFACLLDVGVDILSI